jgi:hypothetical protein
MRQARGHLQRGAAQRSAQQHGAVHAWCGEGRRVIVPHFRVAFMSVCLDGHCLLPHAGMQFPT